MNAKHLSVLAAVGPFVVAGAASAALDLTATVHTGDDHGFWFGDFPATGLQSVEVFLTGLNAGDRVDAIYGSPASPMTIATGDGSDFFISDFLDYTIGDVPSPLLFPAVPELHWHTHVQIGGESAAFTPGFIADFGSDGFVGHTNHSWFVDGGVISDGSDMKIGQFTFDDGAGLTLEFGVEAIVDGEAVQKSLSLFIPAAPAPGALVMLGLAGLAGSSRRRR